MKRKTFLPVVSLLLVLSVFLGGCGASLKIARVAGKFGSALKQQPITSATAEVSCEVTAGQSGDRTSAKLRAVVHSRQNWDQKRTYSDIESSFNLLNSDLKYALQCYENYESGDSVRYVHVDGMDLWLRLQDQIPVVNLDPALVLVLLDTVSEGAQMTEKENPNTGNLTYVISLSFNAEDIRSFAQQAGIKLPQEMMDCDLSGVTVPMELELEDKTFLPLRVQVQLKGLNASVVRSLAAVFGKGEEVGSLNLAVEELSLLITNFGYETQDIPMLPMGAAENALDMKVVREILNHGE